MASTSINDHDGLNLPGLEEHYLASNNVIDRYKSRIPQWKSLKNRVDTGFSMKAVSRGVRQLRNGKFAESIASFTKALKFYPLVFAKGVFWTFIWALIIKQVRKVSKFIIAG
jgi:hypothetical protein